MLMFSWFQSKWHKLNQRRHLGLYYSIFIKCSHILVVMSNKITFKPKRNYAIVKNMSLSTMTTTQRYKENPIHWRWHHILSQDLKFHSGTCQLTWLSRDNLQIQIKNYLAWILKLQHCNMNEVQPIPNGKQKQMWRPDEIKVET